MRAIKLCFTLCLALILSACSTFNVSTDYNPKLTTDHWKNYRWQLADISPKDPYDSDLTRQRIVNAMNKELQAKGFNLTENKTADFHISYFFLVEPKIDVHRFYNHRCPWVGCSHARYETYVDEYQYGSIIVDIHDGTTNELQWRGIVGSRVSEGATPQEREETIGLAITELMKAFPPKESLKEEKAL
ncbi:DUF4136 domain-containing protein [Litoribrevibacter euphylliae]|uniref:DUF4136 domain-containing protein n=1 Tax=Litoribrevibacter euphylliae TaxID=1834034 RepID=A0ABV7HK16_9GAMM